MSGSWSLFLRGGDYYHVSGCAPATADDALLCLPLPLSPIIDAGTLGSTSSTTEDGGIALNGASVDPAGLALSASTPPAASTPVSSTPSCGPPTSTRQEEPQHRAPPPVAGGFKKRRIHESHSSAGVGDEGRRPAKRRVTSLACEACRRAKNKCIRDRSAANAQCSLCAGKGIVCVDSRRDNRSRETMARRLACGLDYFG